MTSGQSRKFRSTHLPRWLRVAGLFATLSIESIAAGPVGLAHELAWDEMAKVHRSSVTESKVRFSFAVRNPTDQPVVIETVHPSCGCTTVELPPLPWTLAPRESGTIGAVLNVAGKPDFVEKTLTVVSSLGAQVLTMQVFLTPEAAPTGVRELNRQLAQADRQAIFRTDCVHCHVPSHTFEKNGEALFAALCAICHEAPHRAAVVPDLAAAKGIRDEAFWAKWIAEGRDGSLMPAFARERGGVLSPEQIYGLAKYAAGRFGRATEPLKNTGRP